MARRPNAEEVRNLRATLLGLLLEWPVEKQQLQFGKITEVREFADALLRFSPFSEWIKNYEVAFLVAGVVTDAFKVIDKKEIPELAKTLRGVLGQERIEELEQRLSDFLRSLPRPYHSYWYLPSIEPFGLERMQLAEDVALVKLAASDDLPTRKEYPTLGDLFAGGGLLAAAAYGSEPKLVPGRMYLKVTAQGFATEDRDTSANILALSRVKQVLEFCRCLGLFQITYGNPQGHCFSQSALDPKSEHVWVNQPPEITRYLGRVTLAPSALESAATAPKIADPRKPEVQSDIFLKKFRTAAEVLRRPADDTDAMAIRTACEWSFDARINSNETISFLQHCIGLEAILGEGANLDDPLVSQLSDRCAYLIGKTIRERREIKEKFKAIYKVRSKLVHGRGASISPKDADMLYEVQRLLTAVIARETSLISAQ